MFRVSSFSWIARDCGWVTGVAPLSKKVIVPPAAGGRRGCHAVRAPGPIVKLLRLPPSSQRTIPVRGSTS